MDLRKILVIDDEIGVREALRAILKDQYQVFTAESGAEAIRLLKADEEIELAILDVIMPEMDGIEALKQIKKIKPQLPIVMITATRNLSDLSEAMHLGAVDYITKPFQVGGIKEAITKALTTRKQNA